MKSNKVNYGLVGLGVLFILFFVWFYWSFQEHSKANEKNKYYNLSIDFTNITGIFKGSIVSINGVPVGEVVETILDDNNAIASVKIAIERKYKLPTDSVASVYTDGLLGSNYINITPGVMDEYLEEGDVFEFSQNTLPVLDFIKMIVDKVSDRK